jgi:hypothetical protein
MKANEAPEKIWVHELSAKELNVPMKEYHVEYTRTDAFIEKAERYIRSVADGLDRDDDVEAFISGFRKYMEGE